MLAPFQFLAHAQENERPVEPPTFYRTIEIDGLSIFYREAGPNDAPRFSCCTAFPRHRACTSLFSLGSPIAFT